MKRQIRFEKIVEQVRLCCLRGTTILPDDVYSSLESASQSEHNLLAKDFLNQCLENANIAKNEDMPICQDTGFAVYFVELGQDVEIIGGSLSEAINEGTRQGYRDGYLRKSIVNDPLFERKNTKDNTPAVIHYDLIEGDRLSITFAPKGGGSENMSGVKMLKPSDGRQGVIDFVVNSVIQASGNPCPPTIVGVGIGGTFEKCAFLAKKALLRKVGEANTNPLYAELEAEILAKINESQVGPQGLGGDTTALAVHIEYYPCHIASMPLAVNLNCHAARHYQVEL